VATGTKNLRIEFPISTYTMASAVTVNGIPHPAGDWSSAEAGGGVGVVSINNVGFSTKTIVITFVEAIGGSGGSSGVSLFTNIRPESLNPIVLATTLQIPTVVIAPGETKAFDITVVWSGSDSIKINEVTFSPHADWFTVEQDLPATYVPPLHLNGSMKAIVPVNVTVPRNVTGVSDVIEITVLSSAGSSRVTDVAQLRLIYASQPLLAWFAVMGVLGVVIVGVFVSTLRRRREGAFFRR
ncbi:MAG: hypothetical protein MN733_14810, partial [Nitrososphaera sp.]|nr:hypothetical protein [Nitrososphaera sp.]